MSGVVTLVRRPLSSHSVLRVALGLLEARGVPVCTAVVTDDRPLPPSVAEATLVVLRDVPAATLSAMIKAAPKATCCNSVEATARTTDKAGIDQLLRGAGVRVPASEVATSWAGVRAASAARALVVKPPTGRDGQDVILTDPSSVLPESAPYPGPYLLQELVPGDGVDRKLYVIDQQIFGVLRPWPAATLASKRGRPYHPTAAERTTALAAGEALRLEVFGVDLLGDPGDPVVVDVNPMPGFQGVPGIAGPLSDHFVSHCRSEEVTA